MNEKQYPNREDFEQYVFDIKRDYADEANPKDGIFGLLAKRDEYDKTNVFDFLDDEWFDLMYGKVELVMGGSWYAGDGSFEHRIAEIAVAINIGHILRNGNKRSSTLVLLALCMWNDTSPVCSEDEIHGLALHIAKNGNEKKEESVVTVREFLKKNIVEIV